MDVNGPFYNYLTPEENVFVRAACTIAENEDQLRKYRFWGKLYGTAGDYYVIQTTVYHPFRQPETRYSRDGQTWSPLPPVPETLRQGKGHLETLFNGDPTASATIATYDYANDIFEQKNVEVKEDERLAYIVGEIDKEGFLPKDAYRLEQSGLVVPDLTYGGMDYDKIHDMRNYSVFRSLNYATYKKQPDKRFLRPLLEAWPENRTDHPRWRVQDRIPENCVVYYNTHWPGLMWYHMTGTASFGMHYFGSGIREINMPFICTSPSDSKMVVDLGFTPAYDYKQRPMEPVPVQPATEVQKEPGAAGDTLETADGETSEGRTTPEMGEVSEDDNPSTRPTTPARSETEGETGDEAKA